MYDPDTRATLTTNHGTKANKATTKNKTNKKDKQANKTKETLKSAYANIIGLFSSTICNCYEK